MTSSVEVESCDGFASLLSLTTGHSSLNSRVHTEQVLKPHLSGSRWFAPVYQRPLGKDSGFFLLHNESSILSMLVSKQTGEITLAVKTMEKIAANWSCRWEVYLPHVFGDASDKLLALSVWMDSVGDHRDERPNSWIFGRLPQKGHFSNVRHSNPGGFLYGSIFATIRIWWRWLGESSSDLLHVCKHHPQSKPVPHSPAAYRSRIVTYMSHIELSFLEVRTPTAKVMWEKGVAKGIFNKWLECGARESIKLSVSHTTPFATSKHIQFVLSNHSHPRETLTQRGYHAFWKFSAPVQDIFHSLQQLALHRVRVHQSGEGDKSRHQNRGLHRCQPDISRVVNRKTCCSMQHGSDPYFCYLYIVFVNKNKQNKFNPKELRESEVHRQQSHQ